VAPELAAIERRGHLRRRRGLLRACLLAAAIALCGSGVVDLVSHQPPPHPVTTPRPVEIGRWPGDPHRPLVEAATYRWRLSNHADAPRARLTVGNGWLAYVTLRHDAGRGLVTLLVAQVDGVVATSCAPAGRGMQEVGADPADVTAAIARAPGLEQTGLPRRATAFGHSAEVMRLRTTPAVRCRYGEPDQLLDTPQGPVYAPRPGSSVVAWVVDVAGRAVVVMCTSSPRADAIGGAALRHTLGTLELAAATPR
jgi:hypothetical protein